MRWSALYLSFNQIDISSTPNTTTALFIFVYKFCRCEFGTMQKHRCEWLDQFQSSIEVSAQDIEASGDEQNPTLCTNFDLKQLVEVFPQNSSTTAGSLGQTLRYRQYLQQIDCLILITIIKIRYQLLAIIILVDYIRPVCPYLKPTKNHFANIVFLSVGGL